MESRTEQNNKNWRGVLTHLFLALHRQGVNALGVGDLLTAVQAVEQSPSHESLSEDAVRTVLLRLWSKSLVEADLLESLWAGALMAVEASPREKALQERGSNFEENAPDSQPNPPAAQEHPTAGSTAADGSEESLIPGAGYLGTMPVRAPFVPAALTDSVSAAALEMYGPVSHRFFLYAWRHLRRPVADGPKDILDVSATVERAVAHGRFAGPVYRCRERSEAHLVLLVDQGGSMTPFHALTRDLVETACEESDLGRVEVYYFHNIPADYVYADPYQMRKVALAEVTARCSAETSVLIVSDAGSARGHRRLPRIRETTTVLNLLKRSTPLIAWLNPMPAWRWSGSSAQILAHLIPMFPMDEQGVSDAVDVLRGQPRLRH